MPRKKIIIIGAILAVLLGGLAYLSTFRLKTIRVTGCEAVDEQVIIDAVNAQKFSDNTLLVYLLGKIKPIENIPFVSKMEIEYVSKNEIEITVYEKSMAGCVEYMDGYVYFDKDGIVLDTASEMIAGIPCIKGLCISQWEMGQKLPIDDESRFQTILSITQLTDKYELEIDGIKFTSENEIVLFCDGFTIELGEGEYLAMQMMNLGSMLEGLKLKGLEGTIHMKDFNQDNATASFSMK